MERDLLGRVCSSGVVPRRPVRPRSNREDVLEAAWALLEAPSCSATSAKQLLSRVESAPDDNFHIVKQVGCIVAAAHLRNGRAGQAGPVLSRARRGLDAFWLKDWNDVYTRCRQIVPELEKLLAQVLVEDEKLPRYFRMGLESCELAASFSGWRKLVVFDAHELKLLVGRQFVQELFPTLVGVEAPPSLISSLPLAPAAFGEAVPSVGDPFFQDITWVAAADPDSGEGVVVRLDESAFDVQFVRDTPLSHVRREIRGFLEEAHEHDPEMTWDVSTCTNNYERSRHGRRNRSSRRGGPRV